MVNMMLDSRRRRGRKRDTEADLAPAFVGLAAHHDKRDYRDVRYDQQRRHRKPPMRRAVVIPRKEMATL